MQKNLERLIDTVAFSTFHFFFGDDGNDTLDDSDNENDGIAFGSTLFADGNIDWQERIWSWFETEILGKLIFKLFSYLVSAFCKN